MRVPYERDRWLPWVVPLDTVDNWNQARLAVGVPVIARDRHPASVVRPDSAPRLLTSLAQRFELLADAGIDCVHVLRFDDTAAEAPDESRSGARDLAIDAPNGASATSSLMGQRSIPFSTSSSRALMTASSSLAVYCAVFAVMARYALLARRIDQPAALLAVPEVAWTVFATVLSTTVAAINSR